MSLVIVLLSLFSLCFCNENRARPLVAKTENCREKIYKLSIKSEYLDLIVTKSKTVEIRLNVPDLECITKNDLIVFYDENERWSLCQVEYAEKYQTFDELLAFEGIANAIPIMKVKDKTGCELIQEGVEMIYTLPGYKEKVKDYGALAIKIKYLDFSDKASHELTSINNALF